MRKVRLRGLGSLVVVSNPPLREKGREGINRRGTQKRRVKLTWFENGRSRIVLSWRDDWTGEILCEVHWVAD
jgi:hypothetical protein